MKLRLDKAWLPLVATAMEAKLQQHKESRHSASMSPSFETYLTLKYLKKDLDENLETDMNLFTAFGLEYALEVAKSTDQSMIDLVRAHKNHSIGYTSTQEEITANDEKRKYASKGYTREDGEFRWDVYKEGEWVVMEDKEYDRYAYPKDTCDTCKEHSVDCKCPDPKWLIHQEKGGIVVFGGNTPELLPLGTEIQFIQELPK